jgi:glycosyltransferase involved in cell wall biosynthesis
MPAAIGLVEQHGLEDVVRFRGWLRGEDLEAAFREADVFVLPSWAEGFPNAMIEAMAAGLAVVVTSVGNIPDIVRGGVHARVVPPRDPAALDEAILALVTDGDSRWRLAAAAHALAASTWGVERAADDILAALVAAARPTRR